MKILEWSGENKNLVRKLKAETALKYYRGGNIVSLPGANCKLEKLLVAGGVPARKITGIQSVYMLPNHSGEEVFKLIEKSKRDNLNDMVMWPGDILDFFKRLRAGKLKNDNIRKRLVDFLDYSIFEKDLNNIELIDIDLCGIFSKKLLALIREIFKTKSLSDNFTLFLNVQKGRDVRGNRLFNLMKNNGVKTKDLDEIRYFYFPYIVLRIAKKYKYLGNVLNLFEYSDKNENNIGVNMLQFVFRFRRTEKYIPDPVRRAGYYYFERINV